MRILPTVAAAIVAALLPAPAGAVTNAIDLLRQCEGREPAGMPELGTLTCATYLSGFLDMHALMVFVGARPLFCPPTQGIQNEQALRIFVRWGQQHPELLHQSARIGAAESLREAFPCR